MADDKYKDKPNVPVMMEMTGLSDEIVEDYLDRFDDNLERAMNGWLIDCDAADEETVKENKEREMKEKKESKEIEITGNYKRPIHRGPKVHNPFKNNQNSKHVLPKESFHEKTFKAYYLISRADYFPLDVSKYIIFFILREGMWFENYECNFDSNGILYYLGTDEGKKALYTHPETLGYVSCTPTNIFQGSTQQAFSHTYQQSLVQNWCYKGFNPGGATDPTKELFMAIQFHNHSVIPIKYTIRHGYPGGHALRNWNFEGSKDGEEWIILSQHINDSAISDASLSCTASFDVPNTNEAYSHFRILVTGRSSGGSDYLMMAGFEIYGCLRCI